jgi:hypothetical protein
VYNGDRKTIKKMKEYKLEISIGLTIAILALAAFAMIPRVDAGNPNNGGKTISSPLTGQTYNLPGFLDVNLSTTGGGFQSGYARIFDNAGNETVRCTTPTNTDGSAKSISTIFPGLNLSAGTYTLFIAGFFTDCNANAGATLAFLRTDYGESADISFTITDSQAISFAFPQNGTTTYDFANWTAQIWNATGTPNSRWVVVDYSMTSSSVGSDKVNSKQTSASNAGTFQVSLPKTVRLATSTAGDPVWYARASLVEGTQTIATSSLISFTVRYLDGLLIPGSGDIAPTDPAIIQRLAEDCSAFSGGLFSSSSLAALSCYAKDWAHYVFVELWFYPQMSTGFLTDSWEEFQDTFPFSVFFTVQDSLESAATTTAGSYELSFAFGGGAATVNLLNSSTLENAVGSTTKNLIFNIEKSIIWLGTAAAIIFLIL